jgi:hypothetical protein
MLETQSVIVDDTNLTVTFGFGNTLYGIYEPFEGVFALRVKNTFPASDNHVVKIENVYGATRVLYQGESEVKSALLNSDGIYLLSYDTDEKKLHVVGVLSQPSLGDLYWEEM